MNNTNDAYEDAIYLEYPSGNWAGVLDAALAAVLVPYWNAHADENQVLRAEPVKQRLGPNQPERKSRAVTGEGGEHTGGSEGCHCACYKRGFADA